MSIKRIALFFSAFIVLFVYTFFPTNAGTTALFTATTTSACAVKLDWTTDLPNPTEFNIRYALNTPIGSYSPITTSTTDGTVRSLTITELIPNTSAYFFDIQGLLSGNSRKSSSPKSVPTNALPPKLGVPILTSATSALSGGAYIINLGFSGSGFSSLFDSFGGVHITRNGNNIFDGYISHPSGEFSYSDIDGALNSGNAYTYAASFYESDNGCAPSEYVYSNPLTIIIPSVPTNVAAVFSLPDKVTVSWQPGIGQSRNEIYRDGVHIGNTNASETSFTSTSTTPSAKYVYSVRGCSNTGCSAFNEANPVTIENAPQNLQAMITSVSATKASVLLSWDNGWPDENYTIEQAGVDNNFKEIGTVLFPSSDELATFLVVNLSANSSFKFRVKAELVPNYSSVVEVNTKIKYLLSGQAWSNIDNHGIGWLKFACEATDPNCDGEQFSTLIDDAGYLHGGAWASVDTDGRGYGWLSFEKADLVGCDALAGVPSGTECAAKLMGDNTIRGWARFTSRVGKSEPEWDGWVALNSMTIDNKTIGSISPYSFAQLKDAFQSFSDSVSLKNIWGVIKYSVLSAVDVVKTYAQATTWGLNIQSGEDGKEYVVGQAWGGDIVGWIAFSLDECNGLCNVVAELVDNTKNNSSFTLRSDSVGTDFAPREQKKFWIDPQFDALWSLDPSGIGTINPTVTNVGSATTTYSAPDVGDRSVKIIATVGVETASTTLNILKNPYEVSCFSTRNGSINVQWFQQYTDPNYKTYAQHAMALSYSTTSDAGPWSFIKLTNMGTGTYLHNSIATSTPYWYKLYTTFINPIGNSTVITGLPCTPYRLVTDEPTQLGVFSVDSHTLIANWKDNATSSAGYGFEIERMKLTPATTTQFEIATTTSPVTAQGVPLTWKNITANTPFYMWIERSSTTDVGQRFKNTNTADTTYPGCSTVQDPNCTIEKFSEYKPVISGTGKGKTFTGQSTPFIEQSNVGSEGEATTFFYRARACSSMIPRYTTCNGTTCDLDTDSRRNPVCSPFISTSSLGTVIATTTPPMPVIQFATSSKVTKVDPSANDTKYKVSLKWKDDSLREDGVIIERNGLTAVDNGGSIVFENNPANPMIFGPYPGKGDWDKSFEDEMLEPGTSYTYTARTFFDTQDPITGNSIRVISPDGEAPTVTIETPYRVTITIDDEATNSRTVTGSGFNCPDNINKCTLDFEPDETAQVTWNSRNNMENYVEFIEWSVRSCGSDKSCVLPTGQNTDLTALFKRYCYDFSVGVNSGYGWCASASVSNATNCDVSNSIGAYTRNTNARGNYVISSSTCKFVEWQGSCVGTSMCNVYMDRQQSATAVFSTSTLPVPPKRPVTFEDLGVPQISVIDALSGWKDSLLNIFTKSNSLAKQENKSVGMVSSFTANVYDAIASFASEIKNIVTSIFSANAATTPTKDYFVTIKDYSDNYTQSSLKDTGLESGAVYTYKVRVNYGGGKTSEWNTDTDGYPREVSGKVLPFGAVSSGGQSPICTRNSYCDFSIKTQTAIGEKSETQCTQNADCVNIGKKRQTSEEQ
ncbi:MAG: fibronectin type III domain-containing protein [Candidatus Paceibacterota bacterium]|jgi:hypothetical protein